MKKTDKAVFVPWQKTYKIQEDTDIFINSTSIGLYPKAVENPY